MPINTTEGSIDASQIITKAMKDAALAASQLTTAKADLAERNTRAAVQVARVQDRIDTIGMGIEIGEATPEDEAEQAALLLTLKAWKTYKYALGKVTVQPTWYQAPVWPVEPPIPEIIAAPMLGTAESI
ncbi:phage tail protein [Pseudomonas sp. D4-18]|uniref:phage tail protein n=1 Tax=Pseudomonas sp. D4-18 TaxID=2817395 RepID=UPI003DA84484